MNEIEPERAGKVLDQDQRLVLAQRRAASGGRDLERPGPCHLPRQVEQDRPRRGRAYRDPRARELQHDRLPGPGVNDPRRERRRNVDAHPGALLIACQARKKKPPANAPRTAKAIRHRNL